MTTYQGVAVATQALVYLIGAAARAAVPEVNVTTDPPEQRAAAERDVPRVNVYLVQVSIDPTFRSMDLPTREASGVLVHKPQVPLDLRYLVSFFGPSVRAQLMLGSVEVALHERPYLEPSVIRNATADRPDLADSGLEAQHPPVRVVPVPLALEQLLNFWSGFFQTPYTLSTMFEVSTVLLDSGLAPVEPPPVQTVGTGVNPPKPPGGRP